MFAYVHFKNDNVRFVCPSTDIENYFPNHVDDFDKLTLYKVLWPLMPKDGSFDLKEEYYQAKIICLGETYEEIYQKVMTLKLKMPQNLMTELRKERGPTRKASPKEFPNGNKNISAQKTSAQGSAVESNMISVESMKITNASKRRSERERNLRSKMPTFITPANPDAGDKGDEDKSCGNNGNVDPGSTGNDDADTTLPVDMNGNSSHIITDEEENNFGCSNCVDLKKELKTKTMESEAKSAKILSLTERVIKLQDQLLNSGKRRADGSLKSTKKISPSAKLKAAIAAQKPKDYKTSLELAPMICDAIKGKTPLAESDEKVHIGNGVYVSKDSWTNKLMSTKTSLAARDLVEQIYMTDEIAHRSLEGGTCPNPNSSVSMTKSKATPKKIEAILGVCVGKMMAKGITDPETLNLVIKNGRATLAQKFKEGYAKWQSEQALLAEDDDGDDELETPPHKKTNRALQFSSDEDEVPF